MKAARIIKPNESLQIQQIETPKPKGSQVLIKINSSGVCHSDIHLWQGGYEGPGGQFLKITDRGVKYPLIPGHEITGTIESMGEEAQVQGAAGEGAVRRRRERLFLYTNSPQGDEVEAIKLAND